MVHVQFMLLHECPYINFKEQTDTVRSLSTPCDHGRICVAYEFLQDRGIKIILFGKYSAKRSEMTKNVINIYKAYLFVGRSSLSDSDDELFILSRNTSSSLSESNSL